MQNDQQHLLTDFRNPVHLIPHPDNPRGEIDETSIEIVGLADDIKKRGLIQPIVITPKGRILAGHRRRVASIIAGLALVPVIVRELAPGEYVEDFFLAENMQRQDLSPLEEARAISCLKTKLEKQAKKTVTQQDLARRLNFSVSIIRERLAILELPDRVQKLFHIAEIPLNSATKLLKLKDYPEEVEKFADRMVTRQITLNSLDALITRRLPELEKTSAAEATLRRQGSLEKINRLFPENHHTPVVTRESVLEKLTANSKRRISLHTVLAVLDQTCCSCGMMGNDSVCLNCPLPKFVSGVIGRAETAGENWDDL